MNIRRHCWKIDLLVNLCGGLQENSWFMVETSLLSSGNCVAYPLCYSSSCCITQFLIAQKGSLNSYFLQFSLKLVTFLDSWTSNGKLFQRETTLTEKKFHLISVLNQVLIVGSISGQSSMLVIYSTKPNGRVHFVKTVKNLKGLH